MWAVDILGQKRRRPSPEARTRDTQEAIGFGSTDLGIRQDLTDAARCI